MIIRIIIYLVIFSYTISLGQSDKTIPFNKYFNFVREVDLDSNITIGMINHLDIDIDGNFLITDLMGRNIYIFNKDGEYIQSLSLSKCDPGANLRPILAKYSSNNDIVLLNSRPWGFRFSNSGDCMGKLDISFTPPERMEFDTYGNIIGYYTTPGGKDYIKIMDEFGKELDSFGRFPDEYTNLIGRFVGGGLIVNNGIIYYANLVEPKLYKYNLNGEFVGVLDIKPGYFKKVRNNLSLDPMKGMNELKNLFKDKTILSNIFLLRSNRILIEYLHHNNNKRKIFYEIVDLTGKILNEKRISCKKPIILSKNGYVFVVEQPSINNQGHLPNPIIKLYKYVEAKE